MMELKPKELEQLAEEFGAIKYGVQDSKLADWYEEQANVTLYEINEVCIEKRYKMAYSNAEIAEHEIEDCDYTHVYLMFDNEEKAKKCLNKLNSKYWYHAAGKQSFTYVVYYELEKIIIDEDGVWDCDFPQIYSDLPLLSEKEIKEDIIDEYDKAGVWKDSIEDFIYYLLNERKPEYLSYCTDIENLIKQTISEYHAKYN